MYDVPLTKTQRFLRWLPTVLIVQHTIVFKKPYTHLAKYDHETWPHSCYNIANYEKEKMSLKILVAMVTKRFLKGPICRFFDNFLEKISSVKLFNFLHTVILSIMPRVQRRPRVLRVAQLISRVDKISATQT